MEEEKKYFCILCRPAQQIFPKLQGGQFVKARLPGHLRLHREHKHVNTTGYVEEENNRYIHKAWVKEEADVILFTLRHS